MRTRRLSAKSAADENIFPGKLSEKDAEDKTEENKGKLRQPQANKNKIEVINDKKKSPTNSSPKKQHTPGKVTSLVKHGVWAQETPFYVVEAKQKPVHRDAAFPKRLRGIICYLCGFANGVLEKCAVSGCHTSYHKDCAKKSIEGGYTYAFMKRNDKIYCSLHHCTACFAEHNRTRCYIGKFIPCDQCELAWHIDCIPGGCEINQKREITCPRHVIFQDVPNLHFRHCADCQQESEPKEELVKCTRCFRSVHFKCYAKAKLHPMRDSPKERAKATCHWCDTFDFIRYGEYAMARLSTLKWYPCQVVRNGEYPNQKDPLLGSVGYLCVKWFPYKGKVYHNVISHNRIVAMAHSDYFFVTEAHKSNIYDEWKLAQHQTLMCAQRSIKEDQIPSEMMSNGEKMIRKIIHNKYSKPALKTPRDRIFEPDLCKCLSGAKDRCGPNSQCINRALRLECPKACNDPPNRKCSNRRISEGNNCIPVKIQYFKGKGYGAIALEDVPPGGFVGEYVGEIIDEEEKKRRMERIAELRSNEAQYYLMELDDRRTIDAQYYGNDMRYVNHSCNPNCVIQQIQSDSDIHLVLIATRKIKKGEELSFDYNMQQGGGRAVPICRCKEPNCTGMLSANSAIKKSMYNWEWSAEPVKKTTNANHGDNRALSLPPARQKNRSRSFGSSAPFKRKDHDETSKSPVKRKGADQTNNSPAKRAKNGGRGGRH